MKTLDWISGLFKPVADLVDDINTSDEEEMQIKAAILATQNDLTVRMLEYEQTVIKQNADIIREEARSDSWLTSSWRPITMLFFVVIIGFAVFTGGRVPFTGTTIPEQYVLEALTICKWGLGGYVVGRSAEKVMKGRSMKDLLG